MLLLDFKTIKDFLNVSHYCNGLLSEAKQNSSRSLVRSDPDIRTFDRDIFIRVENALDLFMFLGWFTLNKGRYQNSCFFVKAGTGSTCPSMNIFPMKCVKCCPLIGFLRRLSVSIFARFIDCGRLFGNRGLCFSKEEELSSFPHSPSWILVHKKLQSLIFIPLLVFTKMSQSLLGFTISELASLKLRCLWKFPSHQRLRAWFKHEWPFIAKGVDLIHIHYDWFVSSIQAALTHNHPSKTKPLSLQRSSGA